MKFKKGLLICCASIVGFLSFLYSNNRVVIDDPQIVKQKTEDVATFVAMVDPWKNAIEKYAQKNAIVPKIKCKNCAERALSLYEFDGCLLAWIIKAIPDGHDAFAKNKMLVEEFVKLLSDNASVEELMNFMLKASNNMKQVCTHCHGVVWEKIA